MCVCVTSCSCVCTLVSQCVYSINHISTPPSHTHTHTQGWAHSSRINAALNKSGWFKTTGSDLVRATKAAVNTEISPKQTPKQRQQSSDKYKRLTENTVTSPHWSVDPQSTVKTSGGLWEQDGDGPQSSGRAGSTSTQVWWTQLRGVRNAKPLSLDTVHSGSVKNLSFCLTVLPAVQICPLLKISLASLDQEVRR